MYKKEYSFLKEVDSLHWQMFSLIWRKHIKNFFRDPKVGFPRFSQNITPKTATQQM